MAHDERTQARATAARAWSPEATAAACATALVAVALPWLLAWNLPPSSTFLNQAIAFGGWGALLALRLAAVGTVPASWPASRAGRPVVLAAPRATCASPTTSRR
ncbi:hypothetical protein ABXN37_27240 [Piscinibacter sakaiensis]|uniref:hypothetical protein n=1 Tax=Piscinibacter sakaiensis TaxID=1547922 RepID=UPI00372CC0CF